MLLSATKNRKAQGALLLIALASVLSILLVSAPSVVKPVHATSNPVQYGSTTSGSSGITCALSSTVTSGDTLISILSTVGSGSTVTVSLGDSISGDSYTQANTASSHPSSTYYDEFIAYATAKSTQASDTMTATITGTISAASYVCYEISGPAYSVSAPLSQVGTGSGTATAVASFSPYAGSFVVAGISSPSGAGTAGANFAYDPSACPGQGSFPDNDCAEYLASSSGAQTCPSTITSNAWAEVCVSFGAPVQPIEVTMSNSAPAATVTIAGASCNANATTFQSNGVPHHFLMANGCTFTLSLPSGTHTQDGFSVLSALSATSATQTESGSLISLTGYEQVSESFAYSVVGGGSGYSAPTLTGTSLGTAGTSIATLTTSSSPYWLDYNTAWSTPATLTGSGSAERWDSETGGADSGTSSAGSSAAVAYTHQYAEADLTVNGCNGKSVGPASETGDSWWNAGDTVSVTCNGIWARSGGTGTRAISYNWNGGTNTVVLSTATFTATIAASTAETLNVNPTTQYFVTLDSGATAALVSCNPTIPGDACWYDSGTTASITLNGVFNRGSGSGGRLEDWQLDSGSVNGLVTAAPTTIQVPVIAAPHTIYTVTVTQYQVTPSAGLTLSRPTIANDTGWYDANAQVTITGEGGAATYVVSSPIWANQVSSYGMQLVTNAQAGSINYGSLTLVYTCSSCWTRLFIPTASGLSVQSVTQGGTYLSYSTQGFITSFSATGGSSAWEVYFGQVGSGGLPPATTTSTSTATSSASSAASGGLFSNPSTTSYLEIAGLAAVLVGALAVLLLKDRQGARNIVIKIRNKVG